MVEKYFTGLTSFLLINFWYWTNTSAATDPSSYSPSKLPLESCYAEPMTVANNQTEKKTL